MDPETSLMVEHLIGKAELAAAEALNIAAQQVYDRSQPRVPKELVHNSRLGMQETLAESGKVIPATPGKLEANVVYDSPYAGAQEAGVMEYYSTRAGREVHWEARRYTTEGTGAHYLEDAAKSVIGTVEGELELQGRLQFGGLL